MVLHTYCFESIKILQNWGVDFDGFGIVRVKQQQLEKEGLPSDQQNGQLATWTQPYIALQITVIVEMLLDQI